MYQMYHFGTSPPAIKPPTILQDFYHFERFFKTKSHKNGKIPYRGLNTGERASENVTPESRTLETLGFLTIKYVFSHFS